MSSEQLADGVNPLDAELAATWDVLKGYSGRDTDLGIARRFGGAAAAYSLRDIGAMNGRVVKARRDVDGQGSDPEEDFSANQVQDGTLEKWVNGELESTLPADVATAAAAYSLRKVKASYSGNAVRIRRSSDDAEVNVAFDSDNKVSTSSSISVVSGTVTDTTLGDFISGTDAFVHTWYDQAGSNNAVQATAGNQPKIAENGALLADGIDFDGSDDFLQTSGQVLTNTYTGARSLYGVCKINTDSGYIFGDAGSGTDEGTSFYSDTASDKIFFTNGKSGTLTTFDNITTIEGRNFLISSNYNNNNATTIHKNANNNGYTQGTGSYNFTTSPRFTIGDREGGSSAATRFDGSIQEIIAYDSDQSDNRFKIESNINNYYGLYNDANDLAGNFTVNSSGTGTDASISNESKTGFTATVVDKAGFFGADLNEAVPNGSNLYISFIANLSPSGGTAATPNFSLANSSAKTGNSTGNPLDTAVVEGFNSITVAGTANTCDRIRFTEGNDNVSFIISDLKVSRIARNGFVETWYDQSGNGNNTIQGTANKQPKIVSNGGTHKLEGLPAINFDDATSHCLTSSNYSRSGSDLPLSMMAVFDKSTTDVDYLFAANKSDDDAFQRLVMRSTSFEYGERDDSNTQKVANGGSPSLNTIFLMSAFTGGTTSSAFVNGSSVFSDVDTDLGTQTFDQIDIGANNGDGASSNNPFSGNISELYLFETNLSTDRTTIEEEIANYYNITLS